MWFIMLPKHDEFFAYLCSFIEVVTVGSIVTFENSFMASHAYTASCVINYFHIIERWDEKKRNQPENYLQGRTLAWYNLQRYTMYAGDTRMFYIRHELLSSEHTTLSSRDVLQKVKLNFIVHLVTILKFIEVSPRKLYLRMYKTWSIATPTETRFFSDPRQVPAKWIYFQNLLFSRILL